MFMYTDEQYEQIKETMREFNYYYGYTDHPDGDQLSDPSTTFHRYTKDAKHDQAKLAEYFMGYKRCNEKALRTVISEAGQARTTNFAFNETFPCTMNPKELGHPQGQLFIQEQAQKK